MNFKNITSGFDIVIIILIILSGILAIHFSEDKKEQNTTVYYCVEGHKYIQSREIEAVLPIYGENDLPIKCTGEGVIEND